MPPFDSGIVVGAINFIRSGRLGLMGKISDLVAAPLGTLCSAFVQYTWGVAVAKIVFCGAIVHVHVRLYPCFAAPAQESVDLGDSSL